jgi:transcriptional regulator with XRE-family HTH domain
MTARPWLVDTENRRLAGQIVEAEYARQGMSREQLATRAHMSPSTVDRIRRGDETITVPKLRSIEGVLNLPDDLLTFIIEGNTEALNAIEDTEIRPGLRRRIMTGLADTQDGQARLRSVGP